MSGQYSALPEVKALLQEFDVGSSVAEHDAALERYFVETDSFKKLVEDRGDIVAGDKGTGKTALYRMLKDWYTRYQILDEVEVIPAFNPAGTPVFQRTFEAGSLSESQYIGIWKSYFFSLAANWLLQFLDPADYTATAKRVDQMLQATGLRALDDDAETIFSKLVNRIKQLFKLSRVEGGLTITESGMPIVTGTVNFQDPAIEVDEQRRQSLRHDEALKTLDAALEEQGITLWLVMDRLDEAFQARPDHEIPALRALFRSYLDMLNLKRVRLKLFVRNDLFRRIIAGGFVNLTHVNARRINIEWSDRDLFDLLFRRIKDSKLGKRLDLEEAERAFDAIFPNQVDHGTRKPRTWQWMLSRIGDGNEVKPPRNLIDMVVKARDQQIRAEERASHSSYFDGTGPLISGESLKRGLEALSAQRVEDTLLAEAGERAGLIDSFRGGKAHHNQESLRELLGDGYLDAVKTLRELGFLATAGSTYKVPMLYRNGLSITQGKAFADSGHNEGKAQALDDEDEL